MKNEKTKNITTVSRRYPDGTIIETIYDPEKSETGFAIWKNGKVEIADRYIDKSGQTLIPYKTNDLIKYRIIIFPSEPTEYTDKNELINEIKSFIHKYVDASPLFEKISCYYILLTWLYDDFNELPYLRKRGDFGSGKTRFLQTVGSICYKPIFASGGASTASLFHMIDKFRGTMIIDEADFQFSDEKATISKILNNGNVNGFPILRVKKDNTGNFSPVGFVVFCPKIVSSRGHYQDQALESRFISENSSPQKIRKDIPISLPDSFQKEALALRNKLLMYRFKNLGKKKCTKLQTDNIDPRIKQIFSPLLSVIDNKVDREEIIELAESYSQELGIERGMNVEADVLAVIKQLMNEQKDLSVKEITNYFIVMFGENYEKKISPKWIGWIIRKMLNLKTHRGKEGYMIAQEQRKKIEQYFQRYGL